MLSEVQEIGSEYVRSERVTFPSSESSLLVAYLDSGPEEHWNDRFVLLAPKYGETKKNNLRLSYFLAANGFKVLRFDHANHIGESDGNMDQYSLPGAVGDIVDALNYVENHFEPEEAILIANSLSARCAYRAAALDKRISRLVCVVGVVNLQRTIQSIYQKDIIGSFLQGKHWGVIDILGFDIDSANFITKLAEENMHDLGGTLLDAEKITQPILHLFAAKDAWVDRAEVVEVVSKTNGRIVEIEEAYHEIGENPDAAKATMEMVTRFCQEGLEGESKALRLPDKKGIIAQNRKERNRLRQMYSLKETEHQFWDNYLGKFGTIEQASVYADYFEKIRMLLGTIGERDVVLDAGCGNGFLGLALLHAIDAAHLAKSDFPACFTYFGIDLTPGGLKQAYVRQTELKVEMMRQRFSAISEATFAYQRLDFDALSSAPGSDLKARLPFADNSVDKICSSLVVSYLKDPVVCVREMRRVLKSGGTAVLSSMKPDCDLTVLFHEFISNEAGESKLAEEAQQLLGAAGRIKVKEQCGIYGFYSEQELISMVEAAGFAAYDTLRSLGNQANVIRITK